MGKFPFVLGEGMIMGRWPLTSCGSHQEENFGTPFPGCVFPADELLCSPTLHSAKSGEWLYGCVSE